MVVVSHAAHDNIRKNEDAASSRNSTSSQPDDGHRATAEVNKDDMSSSRSDSGVTGKVQERNVKQQKIRLLFWGVLLLALVSYSMTAFVKDFNRAKPLLYMEVAALILLALVLFSKTKLCKDLAGRAQAITEKVTHKIANDWRLTAAVALATVAVLALIIGLSIANARRLVSLAGLGVFVFGSWLFSWKRRDVKWRPVIGGLLFQFFFGLLILRSSAGSNAFEFLGNQITTVIGYTSSGANFVFNWAASGFTVYAQDPNPSGMALKTFGGAFAFSVLPTIVFFSSLVSMLYYLGVLQAVIRVIGAVLSYLLGTSASESLNAAGNIFVGQTEAPLLIRPFLKDMTESELHAVMTGGFATIAGGVMAIYIKFGVSSSQLLAASVMSAPAALAISKLLMPETEESKTAAGTSYTIEVGEDGNIIEAAANGAAVAIQLAINIGGQLIAFIAIIAMLNGFLGFFGRLVDIPNLSFELICGYLLYPVAFLMGVDVKDCLAVGTMLGKKIFINEFVAYGDLVKNTEMSEKSKAIAVFALCGFSNFGSIGVQLGGLTPIAPNQGKKLAKLVFSAMIAGNIACFMTACIAGLLLK